MNTCSAQTHSPAATPLKAKLPPHLWRVLARNGITTIEQAQQSYPHKLSRIAGTTAVAVDMPL